MSSDTNSIELTPTTVNETPTTVNETPTTVNETPTTCVADSACSDESPAIKQVLEPTLSAIFPDLTKDCYKKSFHQFISHNINSHKRWEGSFDNTNINNYHIVIDVTNNNSLYRLRLIHKDQYNKKWYLCNCFQKDAYTIYLASIDACIDEIILLSTNGVTI